MVLTWAELQQQTPQDESGDLEGRACAGVGRGPKLGPRGVSWSWRAGGMKSSHSSHFYLERQTLEMGIRRAEVELEDWKRFWQREVGVSRSRRAVARRVGDGPQVEAWQGLTPVEPMNRRNPVSQNAWWSTLELKEGRTQVQELK